MLHVALKELWGQVARIQAANCIPRTDQLCGFSRFILHNSGAGPCDAEFRKLELEQVGLRQCIADREQQLTTVQNELKPLQEDANHAQVLRQEPYCEFPLAAPVTMVSAPPLWFRSFLPPSNLAVAAPGRFDCQFERPIDSMNGILLLFGPARDASCKKKCIVLNVPAKVLRNRKLLALQKLIR